MEESAPSSDRCESKPVHTPGEAELAAADVTILLCCLPAAATAGSLALPTHTHTLPTLGSHRLEGQMLVLSKGADLQKG